jgi:hypothetical protein
VYKGVPVADVIHHNRPDRVPVVPPCNGLEALLACLS